MDRVNNNNTDIRQHNIHAIKVLLYIEIILDSVQELFS